MPQRIYPAKPEQTAPVPVKSFQFSLFELGGALGDLGTLLPLTAGLITLNHMNATSVFLVVGLAYVLAGVFYRLPVPVQPLKAVAAIAIASGVSASVISASGLVMAVLLLFLAWSGAISLVARLFNRAMIRGVQLGVGLLLMKAGVSLTSKQEVIAGGGDETLAFASFSVPVSLLLALALGGIFILYLRSKKLPASLVILVIGFLVSLYWGSFVGLSNLRLGLSLPGVEMPGVQDLSAALVLLVIPQIPLTIGNAVFATSVTAKAYFGSKAKKVTPRALLTTMGLSNLGAGLLGGMPICHGSGGLTAHYSLGARTGGAGVMMGTFFLVLALFLDGNVLPILSLIPFSALGVLLTFVGVQHCLLVRDLREKEEIAVALVVAIVGLATKNLAIGFALGIGVHLILRGVSRRHSVFSQIS